MRGFKLVATAAAITIVGGVVAASGAIDPAAGSPDRQSQQTFTLVAPKDTVEFLDLDPTGPSNGDQLFFRGELLDGTGTRHAGFEWGVCTTLTTGVFHCTGTASFDRQNRDTVEFAGLAFDGTPTFEQAITGGTGRYREATGDIHVTNITPDGTNARQDWTLLDH